MGKLFLVFVVGSGFRIVINTNPQGGQTVYHLHLHVLGGHQNREPLLPILRSRLRQILAGYRGSSLTK